ncbi:MAG: DUF3459 domain-containing protein [Gemmataceae bacterium]
MQSARRGARSYPEAVALHRDLLRLRREDPAFRAPKRRMMDGAVLGPDAFLLRFFAAEGDRLLLVNLGRDLKLEARSHRWPCPTTASEDAVVRGAAIGARFRPRAC